MNFFENALCDLIDLQDKLDSLASEAHNEDLDPSELTEASKDLWDIVHELKKIHVGLVKQDRLMKELQEIQL